MSFRNDAANENPAPYAEYGQDPFPPNQPWWLHWLWGCNWKQSPWTWCNGCFYRAYQRLHNDGSIASGEKPGSPGR